MQCCFTGHRACFLPWRNNESDERFLKMKSVLSQLIDDMAESGCNKFFTGMARGFDTYAAETVLDKIAEKKDITLSAVIPCNGQSDKWSENDKQRYNNILSACSEKIIISPFYTKSCMMMRNKYMVDNSDILVALWNGNSRGGTAFTVRYAMAMKKKIYIIRPGDITLAQID